MENQFPPILYPTDEDLKLMVLAQCHLGTQNINHRMKPYIFSRRTDGIYMIDLAKTWQKLLLAARLLAVLPPESIYVTSSTLKGRRPAIKLAHYLGGQSNQDRFIPGTFTNTLREPSVLVSMDPMTDFQAIKETSYCNLPVIALCNSYTSLRHVDVAIPCNNHGIQSIGLICWFLTRAVLRLRGQLNYKTPWTVMPDMFFYTEQPAILEEAKGELAETQQPQEVRFAGQSDWSSQVNQSWEDNSNSHQEWSDDQWQPTMTEKPKETQFTQEPAELSLDPNQSWADDVPTTSNEPGGWDAPTTSNEPEKWDVPTTSNEPDGWGAPLPPVKQSNLPQVSWKV